MTVYTTEQLRRALAAFNIPDNFEMTPKAVRAIAEREVFLWHDGTRGNESFVRNRVLPFELLSTVCGFPKSPYREISLPTLPTANYLLKPLSDIAFAVGSVLAVFRMTESPISACWQWTAKIGSEPLRTANSETLTQ